MTITDLSDAIMALSARSTEALKALFFHQMVPTRRLPATGVSQSALTAAFVRAPLFLRQGILPKTRSSIRDGRNSHRCFLLS